MVSVLGRVALIVTDICQHTSELLCNLDQQARERGDKLGCETGWPKLTKALDGLQPGLYMLPAGPNVGKSAFALQLAWQVALYNQDVFVFYFTLDDPEDVIAHRLIASIGNVPIRSVMLPGAYIDDQEILNRRSMAFETAKQLTARFAIVDRTQDTDVDSLLNYASQCLAELGTSRAVPNAAFFIDNVYDLTVRTELDSRTDRLEAIYNRLKQFYSLHKVPVVCTAELRKLNGIRRPILDDLKETNKIAYRASCVMAPFNEVGLKDQRARIFWQNGSERMPVLEIHSIKNKLSTFKGRLFYKFDPANSHLEEVDNPAQEAAWNAAIR